MIPDLPRSDQGTLLAASSPEIDFSLVLARMIQSMREDPAQLRNSIYELARIKLQQEAWRRSPPMNILEMRRLMLALETAIERVETISVQEDELRRLLVPIRSLWAPLLESAEPSRGDRQSPPDEAPIEPRQPVIVIDHPPTAPADPFPDLAEFAKQLPQLTKRRRTPAAVTALLRAGAVAIAAVAAFAVIHAYFGLGKPFSAPPASTTATTSVPMAGAPPPVAVQTQAEVIRPQPAVASVREFPLPGVYGVYALSNGELHELEALPGRVPDQRVFMSTAINSPSRTLLPDGRLAFVLYRRDLAADAPERVSVRVVAKVNRAMTFDTAGRAKTAPVGDTWTIRSNSFAMRVAPVGEHADMLVVRPTSPDFAVPAGRYVLVLKGEAYDFSVAGEITDPAQCLERVEAANGAFYSECRRR